MKCDNCGEEMQKIVEEVIMLAAYDDSVVLQVTYQLRCKKCMYKTYDTVHKTVLL